jgi:uncharacterized membrane protein HdeD (DUF308 family)
MHLIRLLFRKWWALLLQGIMLIILSTYILENPVAVLAGVAWWFGILVLASGLLGILSWMAADRSEREGVSLIWSVLTIAFGLLMLEKMLVTMKAITIIFGAWMLVTGLKLLQSGWALRNRSAFGWVALGAGVLSAVLGTMVMFHVGVGAMAISTLFGMQVMLTGIALVLLSLAKKALTSRVKATLESARAGSL